ncbi:MAG: 50S ribosomal protein L30e, partial [Candidatus Diapherotrites archaeon]
EAEKSIKNGTAKLLILTSNAPKLYKEKLVLLAEKAKVPTLNFEGKSNELGSVCGKPFSVSSMVIEDQGKSKIIEIVKK